MFCLFWYKTKLKVFILGKLSDYFSSFVFVTLKLQPRTCRVFRERYLNDRSRKSHGKQFSLSSPKFRAVGSKPTLFIAKFRRTFVSKRKFDETALFVQRTICAKSLELSFARNFEESSREQKTKFGISLALLLHNTVDNNSMCSVCHTFLTI